MGSKVKRKSIDMDGSSNKIGSSNPKTIMERHRYRQKYIINIEYSSRWQKAGNDKMPQRKISHKIKKEINQKEIN